MENTQNWYLPSLEIGANFYAEVMYFSLAICILYKCVKFDNCVARSRQAFTATSAQNHGHFGTFHGHIP
jgi:hypothetical protein